MSKRVFFSFHYQDVSDFRVNVVRNHWRLKPNRKSAGFFDASIWEEAKRDSSLALKRLINKELKRTSSTCVLIGMLTYIRQWVRYEIMRSFKNGNYIFGVHINSIRGKDKRTKAPGKNPFDYLAVRFSPNGFFATLYESNNGKWQLYKELDSSASYQLNTAVRQDLRGEIFQFSELYLVYDWIKHDGYNNFANWV